MKPIIIKEQSETIQYKTLTLAVDKFLVTEKYANYKLTSQSWSIKGGWKTIFPDAYKPEYMHFSYYDDISFVHSDECVNLISFQEKIPQSSVIDWSNWKGLDHVLCIYINSNGNIYSLKTKQPISVWRRKDYISSFSDKDYDLDKVLKILSKENWIRNPEIIDIPYYNQFDGNRKAVEFEYKAKTHKELGDQLRKIPLFKDHYFGSM